MADTSPPKPKSAATVSPGSPPNSTDRPSTRRGRGAHSNLSVTGRLPPGLPYPKSPKTSKRYSTAVRLGQKGATMPSLAHDPRTFMIYGDSQQKATYRALVAFSMHFASRLWVRHSDPDVREIGRYAGRLAEAQIRTVMGDVSDPLELIEVTDDDKTAASEFWAILEWTFQPDKTRRPDRAFEELLNAMRYLDERFSQIGIPGGGHKREMLRGEFV